MEKQSGKKYQDTMSNCPENKRSSFTIRDLPRSERPRERLNRFGPDALSVQELSTKFKNIKGMAQVTSEELLQVKGVGLPRAAQINGCFELAKRQDLEPKPKDLNIKSPESVVKALRASKREKAKEHFRLILLTMRNKIIGISTISVGTLDANLVHPHEVSRDAISYCGVPVILVHNHPSGECDPSEDGLEITKRPLMLEGPWVSK